MPKNQTDKSMIIQELPFKNKIRIMVILNNKYDQDILILAKTMKCCERIFFIAVH